MTESFIYGKQIFDSDDCNRVRDALANVVVNWTRLDETIHNFAAIFALEAKIKQKSL